METGTAKTREMDGQLVTIDESGRKDRRTTEHTLARTLRQRVRVGAYRAVDALREAVSVGVRAEAFQISAACLITHLSSARMKSLEEAR